MCSGFYVMGRAAAFAAMIFLVTGSLSAQDTASPFDSSALHIGILQDWSTHRVIYTRNGSVEDMMKVRSDPRFLTNFLLQSKRESARAAQQMASDGSNERNSGIGEQARQPVLVPNDPLHFSPPRLKNKHSKIDWAVSMGPTFGMAIGEAPSLYGTDRNGKPTCTSGSTVGDFIVLPLKAAPNVGAQANLVGLTNLYSGTNPTGLCGAAPTFLFSYAIGSGPSLLSPVLSLDGKKVAWVENSSAGRAVLHVTTWVANQGTDATAGSVAIGNCSSGASCDVAIDYTSKAFSGCTASTSRNSNSEVYVDYSGDAAFIGADNGILYHVKGIFKGTPTFDFCIPVNTSAGAALGGGVYDSLLNPPVFFITDSKKMYGYTVGAASFTLSTSYTYGTGTLTGPGPVLDAFNNFIYAFSANDLAGHTSVTQLTTALTNPSVVALGPASTNSWPALYYGAYDNSYFNFGPANSKSTLYSCGADSTTTNAQDLFAINFNAATGVMNSTPAMPANKNVNPGGKNGTCSPITEFYDGITDRIFVGMGQHNSASGANVVTMWDVTTQLTSASTTPKAQAANYPGGSSGIIVDNNAVSTPQAESLYFTTQATSGSALPCGANNYCAVKLTQSLLQ